MGGEDDCPEGGNPCQNGATFNEEACPVDPDDPNCISCGIERDECYADLAEEVCTGANIDGGDGGPSCADINAAFTNTICCALGDSGNTCQQGQNPCRDGETFNAGACEVNENPCPSCGIVRDNCYSDLARCGFTGPDACERLNAQFLDTACCGNGPGFGNLPTDPDDDGRFPFPDWPPEDHRRKRRRKAKKIVRKAKSFVRAVFDKYKDDDEFDLLELELPAGFLQAL